MVQNKDVQVITEKQLLYLINLEQELKDELPINLKQIDFSELSRQEASKLIEFLQFAVNMKGRKNVVYEYSNEMLNRAVQLFEQQETEITHEQTEQ